MSHLVRLTNVNLAYRVYSIKAQAIRNTIANLAIGGSLLKNGQDVIHVKALNSINCELNDGDRPVSYTHLVVTGPAQLIGDEILDNPQVRKLSFTGSTRTGKYLMQRCAGTLKRLSLEPVSYTHLDVYKRQGTYR